MLREEGFRRLNFIVRVVLMIGVTSIAFWLLMSVLSMFVTHFAHAASSYAVVFLFGLCFSAIGGISWVIVWVAEGFSRGPNAPWQ